MDNYEDILMVTSFYLCRLEPVNIDRRRFVRDEILSIKVKDTTIGDLIKKYLAEEPATRKKMKLYVEDISSCGECGHCTGKERGGYCFSYCELARMKIEDTSVIDGDCPLEDVE